MAHFAHHLVTALPAPLLPLIQANFDLDYTQAGFVISAFSLAYGLGQLPSGWLADRVGPRILLAIGICGVAVAGLMVGLSQTYIMLLVFLVLMGILGGGYHPSAATLVSSSVEPKNQGRALGFHLIGGSASFFLAPLIAAAISEAWGWRSSFIGLAIPTAAFGVILYLLMGRRGGIGKPSPVAASTQEAMPVPPGRWRRLVVFMVLSNFTQATVFSVIAFIPLYLVARFNISEGAAGASLSIIYSAGLWVSPLSGYLSDRWGRIPLMLTVGFLAGPVIYLLNLVPYGFGIGALLLTIGALMYIRMPVSESYIIHQAPVHRRSMVLGIYYFASMEAGGLFTPALGFLVDRFGFNDAFTMAGVAALVVTSVCSVFLWGRRD
ncbi:MFS transporter [Chloroflexota bacterium]